MTQAELLVCAIPLLQTRRMTQAEFPVGAIPLLQTRRMAQAEFAVGAIGFARTTDECGACSINRIARHAAPPLELTDSPARYLKKHNERDDQ
jgi:hypothetical protein